MNSFSETCFSGTLILKDASLFVVPHEAHTDDPEDLNKCLEEKVNNLTDEEKQYFYSLTDCKVQYYFRKRNKKYLFQTEKVEKSARGIYFTNCFTIGNSKCSPTAMLPVLSRYRVFQKNVSKLTILFFRINHSCQPNTEFHWNSATYCEHLMSIRDIEAGEELTDCYLDLTLDGRVTTDERRCLLRAGYGFWCQCQGCSQSPV